MIAFSLFYFTALPSVIRMSRHYLYTYITLLVDLDYITWHNFFAIFPNLKHIYCPILHCNSTDISPENAHVKYSSRTNMYNTTVTYGVTAKAGADKLTGL